MRQDLSLSLSGASAIAAAAAYCVIARARAKRRPRKSKSDDTDQAVKREKKIFFAGKRANTFCDLVGGTPMVKLNCLSAETGCTILGKCEYLNPGGSSKDRIAKGMVELAEERGDLRPGGTVIEGTSGSTGISLAQVCRSKGYKCIVVMPDDQALEKRQLLRSLGAELELVKPASIVHPMHYVNVARRRAKEIEGGFFANQFENLDNFKTHRNTTAREIWEQTGGELDAFVMSAGTGGTIAGVASYLKEQRDNIRVVLADPQGSSLFHKVNAGVLYTSEQSERTLRRHRYDTITEGIGLDRVTANFNAACPNVDDAMRVTDREAVAMARRLFTEEGLFLGSSSALNCVAAVRVAKQLPPGSTIVTILCGGGTRECTKLYNDAFLKEHDLL